MNDTKRWRGLKDLVRDAVSHGASAIERVHLETAKRPFQALEQLPQIAAPVRGIHQVHDTLVAGGYASVRVVTQVVDRAVDAALDAIDDDTEPSSSSGRS